MSKLRLFCCCLLMVLVISLLGGFAWLDEKQRSWIFRPGHENLAAAERLIQQITYQDVRIDFYSHQTNAQESLHGIWLPSKQADAPVVLYLHGARWPVLSGIWRMQRLNELGFSVLGIDYRGFGQSSGYMPSEAMAYEDAAQAWQWLQIHHPTQQRFIYGHSLGGTIAVDLASRVQDEQGVILEATFPSTYEVFVTLPKWGRIPVWPLLTQRFDAGSKIASIGSPVLVIHGSADKTIASHLGQRLFDQAAEPKRYLPVINGTHHNAMMNIPAGDLRATLQQLMDFR